VFLGAGGIIYSLRTGAAAQELLHEALHAAVVIPTNPYLNDPAHSNVRREILYSKEWNRMFDSKRDMDAFHNFFRSMTHSRTVAIEKEFLRDA
jgi:hypothetical protein